VGWSRSLGAQIVEAGRLRQVELAQDGLLARHEQLALGYCAVVGCQSHRVEPLELMAEVAPSVLGPAVGHPDQQGASHQSPI